MSHTHELHVVSAAVLGASLEKDEAVTVTLVLGSAARALSEGDHLHVTLTKGQTDMLIQHIEHAREQSPAPSRRPRENQS